MGVRRAVRESDDADGNANGRAPAMPCHAMPGSCAPASGQSDNVPVLIKMLKDLGEHVDGRSTHVRTRCVCAGLPAPGGEIDAL